jgi:glycosyltransferase involved in cell wall biosynthesis
MYRVAKNLLRYAPSWAMPVATEEEADLVLLHTIGYPETEAALERLAGKHVVIAQYCLRTTQRPEVASWLPLWFKSAFVWSYYDLHRAIDESGYFGRHPQILVTPLGVDPGVFTMPPAGGRRMFTIATSGYVAASETVTEVSAAVLAARGLMFHLGPPGVVDGTHVTYGHGISDQGLRDFYQRCSFVAGLRHVEGFELPVLEGLMCGARPVVFDQPHYSDWYEGFAEFIPEGTTEEITAALTEIFLAGPRPVTERERQRAVRRFAWKEVAAQFWRRVEEI